MLLASNPATTVSACPGAHTACYADGAVTKIALFVRPELGQKAEAMASMMGAPRGCLGILG